MVFRLAILGNGNLARLITDALADRPHYAVVGTFGRDDEMPTVGAYDLLVEVAAPDAVRSRVLPAVEDGATALIASVGALADADLRRGLEHAQGRALIASGAIGGLDHVRALALSGAVQSAHIASSKLPGTLIQPWMDDDLVARLRRGVERIVVAAGSAEYIAGLFPRSANVAVAVALAANAWGVTTAEMIADPAAINTTHAVTVKGTAGSARFEVSNVPSPLQPRSSMVVASSLVRSIDVIAALHADRRASAGNFLSLL